MKKLSLSEMILIVVVVNLISYFAHAKSQAGDVNFRFCSDITQIDKMKDRSRESVDQLLRDKVKIDRVVVSKDRRQLYLISEGAIVRSFSVAFGFRSEGHKTQEGDFRTPEGLYYIDSKNPKSEYYLSLHISYPNKEDRAAAKALGVDPGGEIMIHGLPKSPKTRKWVVLAHPFINWTRGCIAMTDAEILETYRLVSEGTAIEICPVTSLPKVDESQKAIEPLEPTKTFSIF